MIDSTETERGRPVDNNVPLTEHGLFWLSNNEQKKLWGTLYVDEMNEARLETFGSLIDPNEGGLHTILGHIRSGQVWVTLVNCFPTKTPYSLGDGQTDWSHQTCLVNGVVKGIGFEEGEEIAFHQATLSISTLTKWANPNVVKLAKGEDKPIRWTISIDERSDESARVDFGGEAVKISLRFLPKQESRQHGVITRVLVEDHCYLTIEKAKSNKIPLKGITSVAKAVQNLLSICCNETSVVTSFLARHEKDDPPAHVYVRMWGSDSERKEDRPYPALSLEDLGGVGGVARWLQLTETYGVAVELLTSNWYNEKAYNEDKLFRMYVAVEGLLSRNKNRERAYMSDGDLAKFVSNAIPGFSSITGRIPEEWATEVKEVRNRTISHSDPSMTVVTDGRKMHVMTNVLYTAGASFLLKEMGTGAGQIEKYIQECQRVLLLNERQ